MFGPGAGVEVNRHAIACGRQHVRLTYDRVRILVTQQYERDFRHLGNNTLKVANTAYSDRHQYGLNKQGFFAFLAG
ncbi:MAG: hypothetical protein R8G60_08050 [Roseovarius pacificus]|nr:hypothetical protein [Roseovarius pacificus]